MKFLSYSIASSHNVNKMLLDKISFESSHPYLSNIVFISYMKCPLLGLQQVPVFASLYFLIPISGQPNNAIFSEPDYEESKDLA